MNRKQRDQNRATNSRLVWDVYYNVKPEKLSLLEEGPDEITIQPITKEKHRERHQPIRNNP
jgi:hypothetical protein